MDRGDTGSEQEEHGFHFLSKISQSFRRQIANQFAALNVDPCARRDDLRVVPFLRSEAALHSTKPPAQTHENARP